MAEIFQAGNYVAMTGWLALLVGLFVKPARPATFIYAGLVLPVLIAVVYAHLIISGMLNPSGPAMDFSNLESVRALLGAETGATIGWLHFLAFDLIVGTWIARDGLAKGAWPLALVPILGLTFMFGPVGLLTYVIVWAIFLRHKAKSLPYAAANVSPG